MFRPPDRVHIVGFAGDAPGCGDRASSWELVRLLHEVWPDGEPFALDVWPATAPGDDVVGPNGSTGIVLVQGPSAGGVSERGDAGWLHVNALPAGASDDGCADTAILTDPLEHGSLAEQLEGRGYFCVAGASGVHAAAMPPELVHAVAKATGLLPVIVPDREPDASDRQAGSPAASEAGVVVSTDMPYPAVAHVIGGAAFLLGGDARLSLMGAVSGTPSVLVAVGGNGTALDRVRASLDASWPIRDVDGIDGIMTDAHRLRTARAAERDALRRRAAILRDSTRATLQRRLTLLESAARPAVPPAPASRAVAPTPRILRQLVPLTIYLRRGARPCATFRCLRHLVEGNLPSVLEQLDSRWLVSVCDSYADHGDPVAARNALLVSTFVAWERLAATHARWSDPSRQTMRVEGPPPPTNADLWDGLVTVHLRRGDTVNNLLVRYARLLAETPVLLAIWRELLSRIRAHDSVLAALHRPHGHLFDEHLDWIAEPGLEGVPRWRRPQGGEPPRSPGP